MKQIVLDTETTGLEPSEGHRIIEIGCMELVNRRVTDRQYHQYLNPDREIDEGALEVHGISSDRLKSCPRFEAIVDEFLDFVHGAELIIHNAPFDVAFINHELGLLGAEKGRIEDHCSVVDSLELARRRHPGQKNSLDALCVRYQIDNSNRELHGALLDAGLLADVYLLMTGGQESLSLEIDTKMEMESGSPSLLPAADRLPLVVIQPTMEELEAHGERLKAIDKVSDGNCVYYRLEAESSDATERACSGP